MSIPRLLVSVAVIVSVGAAAAPAMANFSGAAPDPTGDATDPRSGRDLEAAAFGYDRKTGTVRVAIQLATRPDKTDDGVGVHVFLAHRSATGCDKTPGVSVVGETQAPGGMAWGLQTGPSSDPLAAVGSADNFDTFDAVQRFELRDPALKNRAFDCAVATTTELGNPANVLDTVGPIVLKALPELRLGVSGVPTSVVRDRTRRITVKVTNPGDAPATGVKVRIGRAAGLDAPAATSLGTIAAGRTVTKRISIRLTRRARSTVPLKLSAATGDLRIERRYSITPRSRAKRGGSGGGDGNRGPQQLCNQFSPDLSGQSGGSLILVPC
ncbi:hypothetical protein AB0L40_22845 [Patulibacter sp. NPDC049589]|uniref:hypothetical protein n=1 Tax=Patulibacter sp. NPDC049589 TaxID=3154731 RepID=UPI0034132E29